MRAERQAADMARRKAEKRTGSAVAVLDELDPDTAVRKPRRVVKGLLAMTVVALGVLGVYSFVSPETKEAASQTPAARAPPRCSPRRPRSRSWRRRRSRSHPRRRRRSAYRSPSSTAPRSPAWQPRPPPTFGTGGWETPGVGGYTGGDVAASTVFFTEGDETQRQAALQLVDAYPQLQGPTPRFFELPADVTAPGLVVVLAGDWQP